MANSLQDGLSIPDILDTGAIDAAEIGTGVISGNKYGSGGLPEYAFITYPNMTFVAGTLSGATVRSANAIGTTAVSGANAFFTNVVASTSLSGATANVTTVVATGTISGATLQGNNTVLNGSIVLAGNVSGAGTLQFGGNAVLAGSIVLAGNVSGAGTLQLGGNVTMAGSAVLNGRVATSAGVAAGPRWGAAIQAGSDVTSAGSIAWVVFPTPFTAAPFTLVAGNQGEGGTVFAVSGTVSAGSALVISSAASKNFNWAAFGDR